MKIPLVAIIGKPNVGKSTLFNRMAGSRIAITTDIPGTTRDRILHKIQNPVMDFFLVDTGGIEFGKTENSIENNIQAQTRIAIEESDLILFMVNGKEELTKDDMRAAELLRKMAKDNPVLLVVNKCDRMMEDSELAHLYSLGLGDPLQISAAHYVGIERLTEQIVKGLKSRHFLSKELNEYQEAVEYEKSHMSVALVGKPNVGKSSLINALLNREQLIVSEIPGTTRDSVDSVIRHDGKDYTFVDTAGLRKHSKIEEGIEKLSVLRTLSSIERSDVAVLVIDSSLKVTDQDQQIAGMINKEKKCLMILANKWDIKVNAKMKEEERQSTFVRYLQNRFPFVPWAPVIFVSAKSRKNLPKIFEELELIKEQRSKRIPTAELNRFVEEIVGKHGPTGAKTVTPKLNYVTQIDVNPPRFVLFVNKKKYFHFSYLRYFENRLREKFGFMGTPILLDFKEKENFFAKKRKKST